MDKKKILKVAGAIGASIVLVGAGAMGTGLIKNQTIHEQAVQISQLQLDKESLNTQIVDLENKEPVTVEVPVEVEKIVEKNVTVEVPVDNGNLDVVLEHIFDNKGKVSYLTEDLDDDEIDQIVDRVVFMNEIKNLAIKEVEKEGVDELDKEVVGNETLDEDDIERFKVYDDFDEIEVDDIDFEDGDGDVFVSARFEQDDVKYKATFKIEFKDSEVEDIKVENIELR